MRQYECERFDCPYQLREGRCGFARVGEQFPMISSVKTCPAEAVGKSRGVGRSDLVKQAEYAGVVSAARAS